MHTGDLAVMREDGYCNIVGRIKDMVIRGGENIYPREIEEFLYTHPDIEDVQVIGVPDEKYGEELCAWIKMQAGRRAARRRRGAGVRDRQARALQDPALRHGRRRVPDDRHRQDPQGRDARGDDRTARSGLSSAMRFGAHLPLLDFDGSTMPALPDYVDAAREAGFTAISANDHLVYQRPWLDGLMALSSVVNATADLSLATTISLPVVRGPTALAKAAAALDILSGGRFVLGVGPGSSATDYAAARVPFEERWPRFDEAVQVLRAQLTDAGAPATSRFYDSPVLEPRPTRPVPIWIGSWGSAVGLRRVARLGDGWLASAYNTTPEQLVDGRETLHTALASAGRDAMGFPIVLATTWTYITDDEGVARTRLDALAQMLRRDPAALAGQVLIGSAEECAEKLGRYAEAGVDTAFIWPLGDPVDQLLHFGAEVAPRVVA